MKIIVTVKHVPETGAVSLDETTGTMKREGVESIPNPLDLYAVEAALQLRERYGGSITAVSMGPAGAERSLREVIAMGCDDAVLVTGREFAGSDTLATSRALSRAIEKIGSCDLLIFGERATDGDTGQVGPGTAALLGLPLAAYVAVIEGCPDNGTPKRVVVERLTEEGFERLAVSMPAALTVVKAVATPRLPTLRGKRRARGAEIPRWSGAELGLSRELTGLTGSPTRVEHIFHPKISRDGELHVVSDERGLDQAAERLADFILERLPGLSGAPGGMRDSSPASPGATAAAGSAGEAVSAPAQPSPARAASSGAGEIWVIAEDRAGHIDRVTWELLGRARPLADKLGATLCVVVTRSEVSAGMAAGGGASPNAPTTTDALGERPAGGASGGPSGGASSDAEIAGLFSRGADRVYLAEDDALSHFVVETRSNLLVRLVGERAPKIILAAATTAGRALMPHLAVRLGTGLTADCTDLDVDPETGGLLQTRPAIGGNIMATIRTRETTPNMATVRPHSAPPAAASREARGEVVRVRLGSEDVDGRTTLLGLRPFEEESVNLQDAPVIVSCGRGFHRKERLDAASELAALLGATLGASREAVDRGWMGYPHQVGLSGKTVSPELYIALGISGAVQHLAGIKTAKTIAAVNSDPDAPIFKVADFGVVGDLFALLPVLVEKLKTRMEVA